MSCEYCDIKMRPLDEDTKVWKGESWKDGFDEGGYIGPSHGDKFRMVVNYDAGFASTEVLDIKFCPFCGEELKMPAEPLIKDEKIRKAVRAWAEALNIKECKYSSFWQAFRLGDQSICFCNHRDFGLEDDETYTISELCGDEE